MNTELLTRKEAAALLGISPKTMKRMEEQFHMKPSTYTGLEPVFTLAEVKRAQFCRMKQKRATLAKLALKGGKR